MKSTKFFAIAFAAILLTGITAISCGSRQQQIAQQQSRSPFGGDTHEAPCFAISCATYFAATGIASGSRNRMGNVQQLALTNAQNMIRQMMEHAYEGMIDSYFEAIGGNAGTDIEEEVRMAGRQTIQAIVGITDPWCLRFSDVDDRGNVTAFIGIRIPKQRVADGIAENLSRNQRAEIRDRAAGMREEMRQHFRDLED